MCDGRSSTGVNLSLYWRKKPIRVAGCSVVNSGRKGDPYKRGSIGKCSAFSAAFSDR